MTHDELVEAVAFNMCCLRHPRAAEQVLDQNIDGQGDEFRAYARAAISIILEEAITAILDDAEGAVNQEDVKIAGALRAMKEKKP